uniref:Uncharacterized protein n=1 Tax=Klebsiella phage vB_KpnM_Iguana_ER37 TaxID=3076781 RepID=A0AB38Z3T0_9CAUD
MGLWPMERPDFEHGRSVNCQVFLLSKISINPLRSNKENSYLL